LGDGNFGNGGPDFRAGEGLRRLHQPIRTEQRHVLLRAGRLERIVRACRERGSAGQGDSNVVKWLCPKEVHAQSY